MNKLVILLVGASGSGKSTWTEQFLKDHPEASHKVVSADFYFVQADGTYRFDHTKLGHAHGACERAFEIALESRTDIILVDNTNTRARERKTYVKKAKAAGYAVWLKVFKVDAAICAARNLHGVPAETIQKMIDRIDVPEGFYEVPS